MFLHEQFCFEIWVSGINRKDQKRFYQRFKGKTEKLKWCEDPEHQDYVVKKPIFTIDFQAGEERLLFEIKTAVKETMEEIQWLLREE